MSRRIAAGFDTETTGLCDPEHRIIEVAVMLYDLDTQEFLGKYEQRINPLRGIEAKAQEVHGISSDDLIGKPTWETVAPDLAKLLGKCQFVVAHNGIGFDFPFVTMEFLRVGVAPPQIMPVDTMLEGRWATADGAVPNLEALCWASNVPYDKSLAHGATYDVEVMMACFFKQFPRGFFRLPTAPYQYQAPKAKEKK